MAAPTCADMLAKLHDAIIALQTGGRVVTITFGARSVSYGQGDVKSLQQLYRVYYRQCGIESGYPDITDQALVMRGPPATIRNT